MRILTYSMYEMDLYNTSPEMMKFQPLQELPLKEKSAAVISFSSLHSTEFLFIP